MTKLHELHKLGQSIWYDNISRNLLDSGGFQRLIEQGIRGMTSNPTIFEKSINGSADYDTDLHELVAQGKDPMEIFEALTLDDISRAAELLMPVYEISGGVDGYISIEVSPTLADDTQGTIETARRYFNTLNRPNIMIKIPATPAGIPAVEQCISEGININITLMFSLAHYNAVTEAYLRGLEKRLEAGKDISNIASVASFFVSRVDAKVDQALAAVGNTDLQGKIAIANAKLTYARFEEVFNGERWQRLAAVGAKVQRPLWASTSTKNPDYPDTLYVDNLIGADTVNTVPTNTLEAILDHATVAVTVNKDMDEARAQIEKLAELGIDFDQITEDLQTEGVASFAKSFDTLLDSIQHKMPV